MGQSGSHESSTDGAGEAAAASELAAQALAVFNDSERADLRRFTSPEVVVRSPTILQVLKNTCIRGVILYALLIVRSEPFLLNFNIIVTVNGKFECVWTAS